jgi:UPF0176 protein
MQKIILFYKFTPLPDTETVHLRQQALAEGLGLSGRILICGQGIKTTPGGEVAALKKYVASCRQCHE